MNISRRNFIAVAGLAATAGLVRRAEAAGELNSVRGKTYVAACPPVKASIPRTPGPMRVMVIGGHPDDADIICGCTAAKVWGLDSYEISECGRPPVEDDFALLMGD